MDICVNFMERWAKQNADKIDYLVNVEADFETDRPGPYLEAEGGPWVVQVFRSITSDSAVFEPARTDLLFKKYCQHVDNSIEKAYVNMIRNADNFIYIENQYFLGSAFSWYRDRDALSHHIIPRELTQLIVNKIKRRKGIKVYICIPMYPEGDPSSVASQEILYWQYCTMESMYRKIARALSSMDMAEKHPTDYLNFFCLGKREAPDKVPVDLSPPPEGTPASQVRQTLRHPIYVHSKLMIVDDNYIIVGSANINQRSLGGNRDTEICIGAFQPSQNPPVSGDQFRTPRGGVHSFRTALWAAHLGGFSPDIEEPGSDTCLRTVRQIAADYWEVYTAEKAQHSSVHLLPYPIRVLKNGKVRALESPWDKFPDTSAPVLGCRSSYLPAKLTT
jgi:phospholipase D1/2